MTDVEGVPDGSVSDTGPRRSARAVLRAELFRFLELFALCGIAIAQPMLDIYGHNANEFVINRVSGPLALMFAFALILVPPIVLLLVTMPLRLISPKAEALAHWIVLAALVGFVVMQVLQLFITPVLWGIFVAIVVLGTVLLGRVAWLQSWFRFLSPAPLIFVVMFLFASEASPVLLGSASSASSLSGITIARPMPVVVLVFDELPLASLMDGNAEVDETLFPNFAALRRSSTWYPNNSSISPWTGTAVPAILSGKYPSRNRVPTAGNYPISLFTLLGQSHKMHVQESVTELCPAQLCTRFTGSGAAGDSASVAKMLKDASRTWARRLDTGPQPDSGPPAGQLMGITQFGAGIDGVDFKDPARLEDFERSLDSAGDDDLYLLHSVLPHFPWVMLPSGRTYRDEGLRGLAGLSWGTDHAGRAARQQHLLQLQYVDRWLGRFIEKMKASGLWDKALIVVTADHGASFQRGEPGRVVTTTNAWEVMWTPLFIRGPGFQPNKIDTRASESVDVLPTIAAALGVSPNLDFDGVSLLDPTAADRPKRYSQIDSLSRLKEVAGGYAQIDSAENFEKAYKAEPVGSGSDDLRIFRVGDHAPLIGKSVADLPRGDPAPQAIEIDAPGGKRNFDPASRVAEVFVKGSSNQAADVAVAVNGTIVAAVPLVEITQGSWRLWTVFPDTRLVPGDNTIELFTIEKTGSSYTLHPAPLS